LLVAELGEQVEQGLVEAVVVVLELEQVCQLPQVLIM